MRIIRKSDQDSATANDEDEEAARQHLRKMFSRDFNSLTEIHRKEWSEVCWDFLYFYVISNFFLENIAWR